MWAALFFSAAIAAEPSVAPLAPVVAERAPSLWGRDVAVLGVVAVAASPIVSVAYFEAANQPRCIGFDCIEPVLNAYAIGWTVATAGATVALVGGVQHLATAKKRKRLRAAQGALY